MSKEETISGDNQPIILRRRGSGLLPKPLTTSTGVTSPSPRPARQPTIVSKSVRTNQLLGLSTMHCGPTPTNSPTLITKTKSSPQPEFFHLLFTPRVTHYCLNHLRKIDLKQQDVAMSLLVDSLNRILEGRPSKHIFTSLENLKHFFVALTANERQNLLIKFHDKIAFLTKYTAGQWLEFIQNTEMPHITPDIIIFLPEKIQQTIMATCINNEEKATLFRSNGLSGKLYEALIDLLKNTDNPIYSELNQHCDKFFRHLKRQFARHDDYDSNSDLTLISHAIISANNILDNIVTNFSKLLPDNIKYVILQLKGKFSTSIAKHLSGLLITRLLGPLIAHLSTHHAELFTHENKYNNITGKTITKFLQSWASGNIQRINASSISPLIKANCTDKIQHEKMRGILGDLPNKIELLTNVDVAKEVTQTPEKTSLTSNLSIEEKPLKQQDPFIALPMLHHKLMTLLIAEKLAIQNKQVAAFLESNILSKEPEKQLKSISDWHNVCCKMLSTLTPENTLFARELRLIQTIFNKQPQSSAPDSLLGQSPARKRSSIVMGGIAPNSSPRASTPTLTPQDD